MPVQSRRQGDDLLVDNVDLKRAARNLLNKTRAPGWTPPSDLNQAMELMASCFGYANLLAANRHAAQAPVASDTWAARRGIREPRVIVHVADTRFDEGAHTRALKRASLPVDGEKPLVLDMSDFDSIEKLRQFRKLTMSTVVCDNVELGINSHSSSELMHVMVNHPDLEFRLLFRSEGDAVAFFQTWVYQDNSPAISTFTVVDDERPGRIVQLSYAAGGSNRPRSLVAYPPEFHAFLRANRAPGAVTPAARAEQAQGTVIGANGLPVVMRPAGEVAHELVGLAGAQLDSFALDSFANLVPSAGRMKVRNGVSLEDLAARADALAGAGPEAARAALENTTTHLVVTPGSSSVWHPAPDTFPADCGPRFDQRWRNLASAGFYSSLAGVAHSGDIVAIIGRPGTGKSLLVNAMAKSMGGAIVDFRLKTWQEDFDRVRRAPPSLVFIEELYHHSEATEMEVAAFALAAKSTKTVFVFQNYENLMSMLMDRRMPNGQSLFSLARVLDLDRMTLNTVHPRNHLDHDERQHRLLSQNIEAESVGHSSISAPGIDTRKRHEAATSTLPAAVLAAFASELKAYVGQRAPEDQIPVIVAQESVSAQVIMDQARDHGFASKFCIIDCRGRLSTQLSDAMQQRPDVIIFDHADKHPREMLPVELAHALHTGHRVCFRISDAAWDVPHDGLVLGARFVIESGFRNPEQNAAAAAAPKASAHVPTTRRKPRP